MVKAGLLVCDQVPEKYLSVFGSYLDMFQHLLPEIAIIPYEVFKGEFPSSADVQKVWLTTGSRHSVYEDLDWIKTLVEFVASIASSNSKYVGVCFGHQMLGHALGGHVAKAPEGWHVGVHRFEVVQQANWMIPTADHLNVQMMCQDQILDLPAGAIRLATKSSCINAIVQFNDNMLGIQGHPEFSAEYTKFLIEARSEKIGLEKAKNAIQTIEQETNQQLISEWIMHFIGERA